MSEHSVNLHQGLDQECARTSHAQLHPTSAVFRGVGQLLEVLVHLIGGGLRDEAFIIQR